MSPAFFPPSLVHPPPKTWLIPSQQSTTLSSPSSCSPASVLNSSLLGFFHPFSLLFCFWLWLVSLMVLPAAFSVCISMNCWLPSRPALSCLLLSTFPILCALPVPPCSVCLQNRSASITRISLDPVQTALCSQALESHIKPVWAEPWVQGQKPQCKNSLAAQAYPDLQTETHQSCDSAASSVPFPFS